MSPKQPTISPILKALAAVTALLAFWALGDYLVSYFTLAFPSAVVGLFLLFCCGLLSKKIPNSLASVSNNLISLLPLFLIPISVGIMEYREVIKQNSAVILLVILFTTPLGLACAGLMVQNLRARK